uniref:Uncharacterized protein n=1 Tax=Sphaerodactylus townsendi TaxID=933632 RepID=A0ACB8E931_9SAUR
MAEVGFLKILHKYEITFLLPLVHHLGKEVCATNLPNLNLRVIDIVPASEDFGVNCMSVPFCYYFCYSFVV